MKKFPFGSNEHNNMLKIVALQQFMLNFFIVNINNQTEKITLTFKLNVEINEKWAFKEKNTLTMCIFECIINISN